MECLLIFDFDNNWKLLLLSDPTSVHCNMCVRIGPRSGQLCTHILTDGVRDWLVPIYGINLLSQPCVVLAIVSERACVVNYSRKNRERWLFGAPDVWDV